MIFVFLSLIYFLSVIISRSIHVAANGIILFLWLSNISLCISHTHTHTHRPRPPATQAHRHITSSLSIPLFMDIYVASMP